MISKNTDNRQRKVSIVIPHFERNKLLELSLWCINSLYANENVEVVIVDDCSRELMRPTIPPDFKLKLRLVQIQQKNGINPCTPFNMGVDHAEGELIVLTSPEVIHTQSIFNMTPNILEIRVNQYFVVPVFAITDEKLNNEILQSKTYENIQLIVSRNLKKFDINLGKNGYSYANDIGAWYSHPVIKDSKLNFLSIIPKKCYSDIGGFDSSFRKGTGFDDLDFLRKLQARGTQIIYPESLPAIHLDHEEVSSTSPYKKKINSNEKIYKSKIARTIKFRKKVEKHTFFDWNMETGEFTQIICSCY